MKIALAQINTTVGDFEGNVNLITNYAHKARDLGADLCVFPEQCIPGYPSHDLLERKRFIEQNHESINKLTESVKGIAILVGFAEKHDSGVGKGLYNSAALINQGKVVSIHRKCLLPTYDVFDEQRYFDSADYINIIDFMGMKLGITICEDVWNDPDFWSLRIYDRNPAQELKDQGAEFIINLSASPFTLQKQGLRFNMLSSIALHHQVPLIWVNSVGGNDDLVFDGGSGAIDSAGNIVVICKEFQEDIQIVDTAKLEPSGISKKTVIIETEDSLEAVLKALILGTKDYARKCGFTRGLVGLSGGIDSALIAVIGAEAFGADNMDAMLMPSRYSSDGSVVDAKVLAENLGISIQIVSIDPIFKEYLHTLHPVLKSNELGVTEENIQARIRGNILMAKSNYTGSLLLTTGNKSEMATGYCTLYGDMAGGFASISDVPKTMVYRLCELINRGREIIPQAIIDKPPSAELRPDQKDSDSLPDYGELDQIIEGHILHDKDRDALEQEGFDSVLIDRILHLIQVSEYKRRQAPPGIKLTAKAFGSGRRMPLAQRWKP